MEFKRTELEETYNARKEKQEQNIKAFKEEVETLQEEIEKQKQFIRAQFTDFVTNTLFIGVIILFLLLCRFVLGRIIVRFSATMTEKRKVALIRLNTIIFNGIVIIGVLAIVFSQFVSLLPFVALLGTGLAFAVRDSISSFIGWFVIDSHNGYHKGDVIRVDSVYGRVREVTPFMTVVQNMSPEHGPGRMITVSNKFIFEKEIANSSRTYGFVRGAVSFLLTPNSDIEKARKMLLEIDREGKQRK